MTTSHRASLILLVAALCTTGAAAQAPSPSGGKVAPIQDNSFLIEEAYNQESHVVQHISTFSRAFGQHGWVYSLTQEWPVAGQRNQLSFTAAVARTPDDPGFVSGFGDLALNYRLQLLGIGGGPVAFAPRLSTLLPTGNSARGLGSGAFGMQVNLPLSIELGDRFVLHSNAGATRLAGDGQGGRGSVSALTLGQSVVWLATPRVNLLVETVWTATRTVRDGARTSAEELLIVPGIRWAHDLPRGLQVVPGLAWPLGAGPSRGSKSLFAYLSLEHPF